MHYRASPYSRGSVSSPLRRYRSTPLILPGQSARPPDRSLCGNRRSPRRVRPSRPSESVRGAVARCGARRWRVPAYLLESRLGESTVLRRAQDDRRRDFRAARISSGVGGQPRTVIVDCNSMPAPGPADGAPAQGPSPAAQSPIATTTRGRGTASSVSRAAARIAGVMGPVTVTTSAWRGDATISQPSCVMS